MKSIQLSQTETQKYEDDGPIGNDTRRKIKRRAQDMANQIGKAVEIYAADGYVLDYRTPEDREERSPVRGGKFVVRGKSGKVVGRYATEAEARRRIEQLKAGAERLKKYQFKG